MSRLYRRLCSVNSEIIRPWGDPDFERFGQMTSLPAREEMDAWFWTVYRSDGAVYVPDYPSVGSKSWKGDLENRYFGGMPAQVGSCCGRNTRMNGMEYHKGHEIILALTPLVLFLGYMPDIRRDFTGKWSWDSSRGMFFYIPGGKAVELYSTTLHLAPCRVSSEDFKSLIILPRDTNLDLEHPPEVGSLLFKKNKWMICHPDSPAASNGAFPGITGSNRAIIPLDDNHEL